MLKAAGHSLKQVIAFVIAYRPFIRNNMRLMPTEHVTHCPQTATDFLNGSKTNLSMCHLHLHMQHITVCVHVDRCTAGWIPMLAQGFLCTLVTA